MVMTDDQKERARRNKERALEIRREILLKKEEEKRLQAESKQSHQEKDDKEVIQTTTNEPVSSNNNTTIHKNKTEKYKTTKIKGDDDNNNNNENEILEDFEIGASTHVTKQDAMKLYCLPQGTLAVCSYIEKDNPRQSKWNKMKLYNRSEVRERARERFGGLDGLVAERRRRELKRFEKEFEDASTVFKKQKK
mmetsp:Transcript_13563/g.16441  ORF Transcript_13563/g.16441 Transcript_13563/m.16441 type:complete len:193 (+) Transcript_13563:647-1225(+)